MKPKIYSYKGFILFDPQDNQQLYNKLKESTFLTLHPKGRQFYCMANNHALKFLKAFSTFLSSSFEIDEEVKELMQQKEISYVERWPHSLYIPTFSGMIWKDHQITALKCISKYKQYTIFLGPGTGKTLISIGAIKMIDEQATKHLYLVVTPKKAIAQYGSEIKKYLPDAKVITDPSKIEHKGLEICIVNYESVQKFLKEEYMAVFLDESHKAKNVSSDINKNLCKLKKEAIYLFTGTPQDKQRDEVFAQLKLINQNLLPVKYLFYNRYFILDDYYKPIKEIHSEELEEIISKCSYGDKTENLIVLPEEKEIVVQCAKGELEKTYKDFKKNKVLRGKDWYALGDSGAKHRTKLTQLCSGFIYDEEGIPHRAPYNPKQDGLINTIKKCDSAIIYTTYNEEQLIVEEILKKCKRSYVIVNGTSKDSVESLDKFKNSKVDFLVIQIVSGNAALDFPHVNNVIYYSLHDSYIYFEQSKYRIRRIGQTKVCNYYYIIVKGTVEGHRLISLKNKKSFNNREFEIYKRRDNNEDE